MSSRLDLIISFVQELDSRSDRLIDSVGRSDEILHNILAVNEKVTLLDSSIDDIRELMSINVSLMNDFSNLYEKSFYLESNMHVNDNITNQTSFETLTHEFRYLIKKLERNDKYSGACNRQKPLSTTTPAPQEELLPSPALKNKSSLANLKLKPIKCNTKRVYKKKSRYRLSGVFNINPIAYEDDDSSTYTQTPRSIRNNFSSNLEDLVPTEKPPQLPPTSIEPPPPQDKKHQEEHEEVSQTSITSEEFSALGLRERANSLPETPVFNVFKQNSTHSNILSEFDSEIGEDKLRFNRLKHFITYANLNKEHGDNNEYSKSPTRPILDDQTDFDNLSMISDVSCYSPERRQSDVTDNSSEHFENFDKFLRGSRFDLNNAFPHILNKSNSQDSIFKASTVYPEPKPQSKSSYKFHNPAQSIQLSSSHVVTPTIEKIHFNEQNASGKKAVRFNLNKDPKDLLNDVISRDGSFSKKPSMESLSSPSSPSPSPSKSDIFSIFNFALNSPSKTSQPSKPIETRRKSIDNISRSLTESFLSLVHNSHPPIDPEVTKHKSQTKETKPIRIKNEIQDKRLPIRIPRNDGGHSKLIIGPNNTRLIDHGESSVFRKPLMRKISHNSLREALSGSLT